MHRKLAVLFALFALLVLASSASANCHVSNAVPIITDWTVTSVPGAIVVDARLHPRGPNDHPAALYFSFNQDPNADAFWVMWVSVETVAMDMPHAVVTDTTLHLVTPCAAGTYAYSGYVTGSELDEAQLCATAYEISGTVTVVDPTPVRASSWGAVKRRWAVDANPAHTR